MNTYVLLSVAPVDAGGDSFDPDKVADDVIECARLGAGMVHLHVRDAHCRLTDDTSLVQRAFSRIRERTDMIIEASTGGVSDLSIRQRCAPLYLPEVEAASLNVGSVNLGEAVYANPIKDVEYCVQELKKTGKTAEVEVFELGMIHTALELQKKFLLPVPLLFSIVLGQEGAAPADLDTLLAMRSFIPPDAVWGITHAHRRDDALLEQALVLGARTVRIGFEDSHELIRGGIAHTNAEQVAQMVDLLHGLGLAPMPPSMARKLLRIGGKR